MSASARDTPMMRQYLAIKAHHPDALLFYRMGDFYELFFEDARVAAPLLDIALTSRDKGKPDPVPMCGVPVHSADAYVKKLAELGHRVAICEQVEDARAAAGRRLVRREVVEVVTPGLVGDPSGLDAAGEVALAALFVGDGQAGLAALDATTGDFRATALAAGGEGLPPALVDELERVAPREVLLSRAHASAMTQPLRRRLPRAVWTCVDPESFELADAPDLPHGLTAPGRGADERAAAALLAYVRSHQPAVLEQAIRLRRYAIHEGMILDAATRAHLELFENAEDRTARGTLIERLDATVTPLGARRLRRFAAYPLLDPQAIMARQDAVARLAERDRLRARLRAALAEVRDLERILARCARPGAEPRDLAQLRASVAALPGVGRALESGDEDLLPGAGGGAGISAPEPLAEVTELLESALVDDPRPLPRGSRGALETGFVREGFRSELDGLRESARKGREWIAGLESRERERLGVPSLKVRFHPVHGYALEVTKANLDRVPEDYERRQTLANAERFTTAELREMESKVLGAHERAAALERVIFEEIRREVLRHASRLREAAERVAELDALQSLAEVARRDGWVRPAVDESRDLVIRAGRHPVVEAMLRARGEGDFVPNDCELDPARTRILLVTGPNMSGKSTYLRQVALLVLLAQMGSFVPAESARIGVVDRVFTRVGASDRLARGESTFMVEMRETGEILSQASPRSLLILDEIGRGTSTYDGLSIAWAVAEYLHDTPGLGARTLFATHFHELADLARGREAVCNAHFAAREWQDEVVFLRRLLPGPASRSYGIQVARLAGLPERVIARAREILLRLEEESLSPDGRSRLDAHGEGAAARSAALGQLPLFAGEARDPAEEEVLVVLRQLDPERLTPLQALTELVRLRAQLRGEGGAS